MYYNKDIFLKEGKRLEVLFASMFKGATIASEKEDMEQHWDIQVPVRVDLKKIRKANRSDVYENENIHWVELKNVNGNKGWIRGEADFFAFETELYLVIVEKQKLIEWVKENIVFDKYPNGDLITADKPSLYKLYTRKGRKDLVVMVKTLDLCYISTCIIKKPINL